MLSEPNRGRGRTKFSVEAYDSESILAVHSVRGVVRLDLLCTLRVNPPLELP